MKNIFLLITLLIFTINSFSQQISRYVVSSTSNYSTSSEYTISSTIGESIVNTLTFGNNILTQGFQQPLAKSTTYGCTDTFAMNYDSLAAIDDSSCTYCSYGCMDPTAFNFDPLATCDSSLGTVCQPILYGCTDLNALNYYAAANTDDGSCIYLTFGCMDSTANNYNPNANVSDSSCTYDVYGCTDSIASNYDSTANIDDGSCIFCNHNLLNIVVGGGTADNEIAWSFVELGGSWASASGSAGNNYVCLTDNCYRFTMYDAGGDGWNGATYTIFDINGLVLSTGTLASGNFGYDTIQVGVTVPCPIYGCTDSTALNYYAAANTDDGSCTYPNVCGGITGVHMTDLIHDRAWFNWDDMNSATCAVDQIRFRYREVGTNAYSTKTMGAPVGNSAPCLNTAKRVINLTASTQYEYDFKIWYQDGTVVSWHAGGTFTTADPCLNATNVTASPNSGTQTDFCWDAPAAPWSFVRLKYRVDSGGSWSNIGGMGVMSPLLCKTKNGLTPSQTYRVIWRTFCNPTGGPYRSPVWDGPITWTQPTSIRISDFNLEERELIKITDILGREVDPEKVIDYTTLFYIFSDGSVEKRIKIK